MRLEESSKILKAKSIEASNKGLVEEVNAFELAIEALSYIDICQKNPNCFNISPLPGQTEE